VALNKLLPNTTLNQPFQEQKYLEPDNQKELVVILNSIENTANSVGSITGNFEKDFLAIGSKIQRFLNISKNLSADSSHIASVITESFLKKGITELNLLLKQFSEFLSKSVEDIKDEIIKLSEILEKIDSIVDNLENFYKIVKQMRMLCISTKIESSRLGDDDRGFNMLADNVEKLANFINDKVKLISINSNVLSKKIEQSIFKLGKLKGEQYQQAEIILSNTNHTLSAFEAKYHEASSKTEEISLSSKDVFNTINKIVVSIQFHDINRQKLEHVSEALNRLLTKITNDDPADTTLSSISDKYGFIHDVCELQVNQLQNARDEFVSAVLDIISNLKNVEKDIDDIYGEITSVLGEETIFSKDSLDDVKIELTSIQSGLNKNGEIGKEISASIKSVVDIVDDLTKDILEIEEVGTEIELIALNAIVKAARTGSDGAALGVLAEYIQRLSFSAKLHTSFTSKILENISTVSLKLKENLDTSSSDDKEDKFLVTNQKISDIIQSIGQLGNDAATVLQRVNTGATGLKNEIESTVSGITIHETFQLKVTQLIGELTAVIDGIKQKNVLNSNRKLHTEELLEKYSMHSERSIHNKFVENTNNEKELNRKHNNDTNEVLFDNNVELF
jgi:methyl-accepting chemotaxis protein